MLDRAAITCPLSEMQPAKGALGAHAVDIAITEGKQREGGGGLKVDVAALRVGADGKASATVENASRLKFSVGIALPHTKGPKVDERL